jgi:hypothetical protein
MEARCFEALRVAFNNNVTLPLGGYQAAQVEPTQHAQERLHRAAQATATAQLSEADNQERVRLQRAWNAQAQNVPAHFPASCTCPDCEAEVAMQQFGLEERLLDDFQQEVENALTGFRLLPQYWGREKGVLFYGGVSPSKIGPIAPY